MIRPRALLLENVRGLSERRFGAYRQHVLDRLRELGYVPGWRLLQASDFGVPQLRPRFVLVALRPADARWFRWPGRSGVPPLTVGESLVDLMGARGWPGGCRGTASGRSRGLLACGVHAELAPELLGLRYVPGLGEPACAERRGRGGHGTYPGQLGAAELKAPAADRADQVVIGPVGHDGHEVQAH